MTQAGIEPELSDAQVDPWDAIARFASEDDGGIDAIEIIDESFHDATKPLLVLVHPGDAVVERSDGAPQGIYENSRDFQQQMGRSIASRLETHDVVVIHRVSSQYVFAEGSDAEYEYSDAVEGATSCGSNLYGDGLSDAAAWIEKHLEASKRPSVYMTGAFSDAENGCVTAIGKALQSAGATVTLDPYSPADPGSLDGQWTPEAPAPSP